MKHRINWTEVENTPENANYFNFKWKELSNGIDYNSLNRNPGMKQIVNHYENHYAISNKSNMFIDNSCFRFCYGGRERFRSLGMLQDRCIEYESSTMNRCAYKCSSQAKRKTSIFSSFLNIKVILLAIVFGLIALLAPP